MMISKLKVREERHGNLELRHRFRRFIVLVIFLSPFQIHIASADVEVAILIDGPSEMAEQVISELQTEIGKLTGNAPSVRFSPEFQREGQWTRKSVEVQLTNLLENEQVGLIVTLGVLGSDIAKQLKPLKPVVAPLVIDAALQGFPVSSDGTSGVQNLHYLTTNRNIASEVQRFNAATGAQRIAIITEQSIIDSLPLINADLQQRLKETGVDLQIVPVAETAQQTLVGIGYEVEAVFILPLFSLSRQEQTSLIEGVSKLELPSFATTGRGGVEEGFLMGAALVPSIDRVARQLALDINDILLGRDAGSLRISFETNNRLSLNLRTAREIGFSPSFELLYEADLIHQDSNDGQEMTLHSVVKEALEKNLLLKIAEQDVLAARQSTRIAKSNLLPQLNLNGSRQAFDRSLVGIGADRSLSASLTLSQVIYSEAAASNLSVSRNLESAETATRNSVRLDTIQQATTTFLNVLIAQTQLGIQRDNLKLTQANVQRAQFRFDNGTTDRSEIYRFETELGTNRQNVASAEATLELTKNELNRLLQRPIENPFQAVSAPLSDFQIFADPRLDAFVTNLKKADVFRNFLAAQALENSYDLKSLDSLIAAQQRTLHATKRARFIPDVTLSTELSEVLNDSGSLSDQAQTEGWSVGLQFSLPLFQGQKLDAEQRQASIELSRLKLQRQQLIDQIDASIRSNVHQASASKRSIRYANDAAMAAAKTLELITDAYIRGKASDIDIVDAQNAALTSQLSSAKAKYQFLLDLINVQRDVGFFDFNVDASIKEQWFERLEKFIQNEMMGAKN